VSVWSWLGLVGLGAFHGINPAMGWLFAVALGLHRQSLAVVLESLIPIALGHALAVALVAFAVAALDWVVPGRAVSMAAGVVLIAWAAYHHLGRSRHRVRIGMRTGMAGLGLWSFLMASTHGAGLMLVPILLSPGRVDSSARHLTDHPTASGSLAVALAAVGVHTLAMLAVTGVVAVVVYKWVGLAFLRRGWINLDLLWTAALVATGALLLATPRP
jgi:hypothetical protein